ncbi:hypothetical protein Poly30_05380 [Planctomycetes bacterium Poly30]|uniref:Uncharacterized protein n=1 Tax=Saltatorellus ferox TaxID=2528018 RepID=A0A518ELT3_9BACT|nr:hypothetical protein Poly30_05380 [Planctomycetes bacterium Poly30]
MPEAPRLHPDRCDFGPRFYRRSENSLELTLTLALETDDGAVEFAY